MKKSHFNPKKIKFLLEYEGFGRVTDNELAEMIGVKVDTIARWKNKSPDLFDRINQSGITFYKLLEMPNDALLSVLGYKPSLLYNWNKKRPNLMIKMNQFFEKTNLTFEMIYETNN
jgi:hypothetical protein